jgi:hypothetical protein
MAVITSRASREFVESVQRAVPTPPRRRGAEIEDKPPIELRETEAQSLVVGSGLVVAAENVPVQTREDLINCTLFAQIAAGKNAQDPKDVAQWYDEYFKALTVIGWAQSDTRFEDYEFTSKNAEAHQAIMKVLTVLLGPQAAAVVVVKTVLDALQSMNAESPWITLFDRQSKTGRSARFQVATAQLDPGGLLQIALVGFDLKTKASQTQVLFFKWKASASKLKYAAGKATIFEAALAEQRGEIAGWLRQFRADFVRQVMLPEAARKTRSARKTSRSRPSGGSRR